MVEVLSDAVFCPETTESADSEAVVDVIESVDSESIADVNESAEPESDCVAEPDICCMAENTEIS